MRAITLPAFGHALIDGQAVKVYGLWSHPYSRRFRDWPTWTYEGPDYLRALREEYFRLWCYALGENCSGYAATRLGNGRYRVTGALFEMMGAQSTTFGRKTDCGNGFIYYELGGVRFAISDWCILTDQLEFAL